MKNKIVFITGSSLGIGKETALSFAKEQCSVIITYFRDKAEALKVEKQCLLLGASSATVVELNVMNDKSIRDCVKKVMRKFGSIDILVNNAGIVVWKPFKEHSMEDIENEARTNLEGLMKITRECLPHIKDCIINISSGAGKEAYPGLSVYCATKFGVRGFTQAISRELKNIIVLSVNPGSTATRMNDFQGTPPEKVAEVILKAAKGEIKPDSERDIDVWDHI